MQYALYSSTAIQYASNAFPERYLFSDITLLSQILYIYLKE